MKLEFIEIILKFRMDCQVGLMGQPGWMVRSLVRSPGDLDSVAPGPVYQKPFPTSAPTLEDFKRLEGGGMGQRWEGMGIMGQSCDMRNTHGNSFSEKI